MEVFFRENPFLPTAEMDKRTHAQKTDTLPQSLRFEHRRG